MKVTSGGCWLRSCGQDSLDFFKLAVGQLLLSS